MSDLVWKNPPARALNPQKSKRKTSKYVEMGSALRKKPEKWALVASLLSPAAAASLKSHWNKGKYGDGFEAVFTAEGSKWNVYARYVGEKKPSPVSTQEPS